MAKRLSTPSEIAGTERARRKERGVTKEGTPRGTRSKKTKAQKELEANKTAAAQGRREKKAAEEAPTFVAPSGDVQEMSGRATGLSEDIGGGLTAAELAQSGANLDIATGVLDDPNIDWSKVGVTKAGWAAYKKSLSEPKKVRTPEQQAQEERVAKRTAADRAAATKAALQPTITGMPASIPLNTRQAKHRQRFFTGESRIRTANPPGQRVVDKDPQTGEPVIREIPRPTPSGTRSIRKSIDIPAEKLANLATGALAAAQWRGELGKLAQSQTRTDPTAKGSTSARQMDDGTTEFVTSDELVRRATPKEALQSAEGQKLIQDEEARKALGLQRQAPGKVSFPGIATKGVVGSSEITPEFQANVEAAVKRKESIKSEPITTESNIQTDWGAPVKDVYDEDKIKSTVAQVAAASKAGNRNYEVSRYPKDTPRGDYQRSKISPMPHGVTPLSEPIELEGSNETERLRSHLASLSPSRRAQELEDLAEASRGRTGVQEPLTKKTESMGLRETQRETVFEPMAKANKALARAVGRDIGSQTSDEAAQTFAIEEGTQRYIQNELMMPPKTSPSQSALRYRVRDARSIGRGLDQTRLTGSGKASPLNDTQIALIRAGALGPATEEGRKQAIEAAKAEGRTPEEARSKGAKKGRELSEKAYLRRMATQTRYWETNPGEVGAMTIMTGEGKVGSIQGPERAVKYPATPASTIQVKSSREAALARIWGPKSVIPDESTGGDVEAPVGKVDRRRRVVKAPITWEQPATGMFSTESNKTAAMERPADIEARAQRTALAATKPEVRSARAALVNAPSPITGTSNLWSRNELSGFESLVTGWKDRSRMLSPDVVVGSAIEKGSEAKFESPQQVLSREEATRKKMGPQFNR